MLPTIIAVIVIAGSIFLATRYILKAKKRGDKCIGCPLAGTCTGKSEFDIRVSGR